jgi:hypothetical protein
MLSGHRSVAQLLQVTSAAYIPAVCAWCYCCWSALAGAGCCCPALFFFFFCCCCSCCWLQGAALLAEGSELLLEIVNPGIIGGENSAQALVK